MPFEPGKSGNSKGRPRGAKGKIPSADAIKKAFYKESLPALEGLKSLLRDQNDELSVANKIKIYFKILEFAQQHVLQDLKETPISKPQTTPKKSTGFSVVPIKEGGNNSA